MNEQELLRRIDRAMDTIVIDVPPPLGQLLRDGHLRRQRRSRRIVAMTVSAIVLAVGGVTLADSLLFQGPGRTVAGPPTPDSEPFPPVGTKFVGMGRIVVAVPVPWRVRENGCARPWGVIFRYPDEVTSAGDPDCPTDSGVAEFRTLAIGRLDSVEGRRIASSQLGSESSTGAVAVREGSGLYAFPEFCGGTNSSEVEDCQLTFAVPADDVFFRVHIRGKDARQETLSIRDSVRRLPERYTTMPSLQGLSPEEVEPVLEGAGLNLAPNPEWPADGNLVATDPPFGSIIPVEAEVRITASQRCPPIPAGRQLNDRSGLPIGTEVEHVALDESGTVAAWLEPPRSPSPLPWLVVYDLRRQEVIAEEDLGVGEASRQESVRIADGTVYYRSSADPNVWLKYQWGVDDFPEVYMACNE